MRTSALSSALVLAMALSAAPLAASAQSADPAAVTAGSYAIEPIHSRVLFSVRHIVNPYFGEFTSVHGTMKLDPQDLSASRVDIEIAADSIDVTNNVLAGELKGSAWFDAAKFPTIRFVSTKITRTGTDTAKIEGDLTLHGVTKPITLEARFGGSAVNPVNKAFTAGFSAHGALKRSDFGVSAGIPFIGDEVDMTVSAAFEKKGG